MKSFLSCTIFFSVLTVALCQEQPAIVEQKPLFVSQKQHDAWLKLLPDGVFTDAEKARMILYDTASVPQSHQDNDGFPGFHDINHNISASKPFEKYGNPNKEFPWKTGGLDDSPDGETFKALILPVEDEQIVPMTGWWVHLPHPNRGSDYMVLDFPTGTKVAEILMIRSGKQRFVFEIRILEKIKTGDPFAVKDNWKPRWFRAVKNREHLLEILKGTEYGKAVEEAGKDGWSPATLRDEGHDFRVFNATALEDPLPAAPTEILKLVHDRKFVEATDEIWTVSAKGTTTYCGTGGIFPEEYKGGFFNSKNCLDCHATVMKHANQLQLRRDWYGLVRGSSGIFSVPLVDDSTISYNGFGITPKWNKKITDAGLLVRKK